MSGLKCTCPVSSEVCEGLREQHKGKQHTRLAVSQPVAVIQSGFTRSSLFPTCLVLSKDAKDGHTLSDFMSGESDPPSCLSCPPRDSGQVDTKSARRLTVGSCPRHAVEAAAAE